MRQLIWTLIVAGGCAAGTGVRAQSPTPNLSGRWVLNLAKTVQQKLNPPRWRCCASGRTIVVIEHREPSLTITTDAINVNYLGKEASRLKSVEYLSTDGREHINGLSDELIELPDGRNDYLGDDGKPAVRARIEWAALSHWDHGTLVTELVPENGPPRVVVRSLSDDAKVLTVKLYIGTRDIVGKTPAATMVFDRSVDR